MKKMIRLGVLGLSLMTSSTLVLAQNPGGLKIGMTTFLSAPAAVFFVPDKATAELMMDEINAAGGVGGVKLKPVITDDDIGGEKLLSEYRQVVRPARANVTLASISSGNCNALAPVDEDLNLFFAKGLST